MAKKTTKKKVHKYVAMHVGDKVSVLIGSRRVRGVIAEYRGKLGVGGRRLYRVEVKGLPEFAPEVPEDELVSVRSRSVVPRKANDPGVRRPVEVR